MSPFADQFPRPVVTEGAMRAPVPADKVWALVGDLRGEGLAEGMVERVEVEGDGPGAIRTLFLPGGAGRVIERIEASTRSANVLAPGSLARKRMVVVDVKVFSPVVRSRSTV